MAYAFQVGQCALQLVHGFKCSNIIQLCFAEALYRLEVGLAVGQNPNLVGCLEHQCSRCLQLHRLNTGLLGECQSQLQVGGRAEAAHIC